MANYDRLEERWIEKGADPEDTADAISTAKANGANDAETKKLLEDKTGIS